LSQSEILAAALDNATWNSTAKNRSINCKHFNEFVSSWLRQWIEQLYQRKADAKDQLCPRSMFGKPIRRLAF
jgi:hypothetical protein